MNVVDADEYIELRVSRMFWETSDGRSFVQKDYRVGGEVWRVHKHDADPFPSIPHIALTDPTGSSAAHYIWAPVSYFVSASRLGVASNRRNSID